jgi:hypothetical protein
MQSKLDPTIIYEVSHEIKVHDDNIDADEWDYDGVSYYRGSIDPNYSHAEVRWLYNEHLTCVGLVENDTVYTVMNNEFATFFQDPSWVSTGKTIWSLLTNEAYQDCLGDEFKNMFEKILTSKYRLLYPHMIGKPLVFSECTTCGKKVFGVVSSPTQHTFTQAPYIFSDNELIYIDSNFVITKRQHDGDEVAERLA